MAETKKPDATEPENDQKALEDLEVDEGTDVQGGRRAGIRRDPAP